MWAITAEEMKSCRWLEPLLVAQINFQEWTPDGYLRHSSYAGLRDDKKPRKVKREYKDEENLKAPREPIVLGRS